MSNPSNTVVLTGRLARDIVSKPNKNGSKTILGTIAVDANYTNRAGETVTDFVPFQSYVGEQVKGNGSWDLTGQGDLISLSASLQLRPYERDGQMVYPEVSVVVDGYPQFMEPRSVTTARRAEKAKAASAPAEAEVPTEADKDAQIAALQAQLEGNKSYSTENAFA